MEPGAAHASSIYKQHSKFKFTMVANKTELSDNYFHDLYHPPEGQGMDGGGGGTHRKSILILHIM